MLTALIILTSIAICGFVIFDLIEIISKKNAARQVEEERIALKIRQEDEENKKQVESAYKASFDEYVSLYGICTTDILLSSPSTSVYNHLYVFEESSMLILNGERIPFAKILAFSLNDDSETIVHNETQYTSTTKTSTGSMLGRAMVGGVLLGGVGALAGATTAKTESVTVPSSGYSTSTTRHRYVLFINLDDLSNPTREIVLGEDTKHAYNVANIFNIIIQRNK